AEAARLIGCNTNAIQQDRIASALELAQRFNACVVLKGCGSVLAAPDGHWAINPTGNAGMASAGMGDVLTGMVAALLAQGWDAWPALTGAVWLHGDAADRLVDDGIGPIGLAAGELIDEARRALNQLIESFHSRSA
ncbi:MAG TPA: NAD(P)H-hydrate dehydratase, partial [Rhodocyclaceae bacterium]|nr:NAD(P)H-hydrate dehydratase [Rhodocyclaceae bacterium]